MLADPHAPRAVIISGANGSGKTSFARQLLPLLHAEVAFLNVDEIQRESNPPRNAVTAARVFLRRLALLEEHNASLAVETTLSSRVYVGHIRRWQSHGYRVILHFLEVPTADFAVHRVAHRVAAGGHAVPEVDVRRRFTRGRRLFSTLYQPLVNEWSHWFTDDHGIRLVERQT